ncbi:V-type ATP synthase subunit E [Candidatus Soleaferrea massiliensis]|uniref:V-type ATP synthase subunit E n=1 Tax=Candidatus Soleaferrea massiliensis TaxID=1470354 RepID=UPI0005914514|nr:V-type ATP synthase subunit E [Candidatus Soleaferrea massiliensis]
MAENKEQEKLQHFEAAMFSTATRERDNILKETEEFKKQELKQAEDDVLNRAYRLIQKNISDISTSNTMMIAHKELEYKQALLKKRQEIFDAVFDNVKKRLEEYTKTPEYETLLTKIVADFAKDYPYENSVICLREQDMAHAGAVKKAYGLSCEVRADKGMALGGVKIENKEHGIIDDESFEMRLRDQHQWFYTNSHLAIDVQ